MTSKLRLKTSRVTDSGTWGTPLEFQTELAAGLNFPWVNLKLCFPTVTQVSMVVSVGNCSPPSCCQGLWAHKTYCIHWEKVATQTCRQAPRLMPAHTGCMERGSGTHGENQSYRPTHVYTHELVKLEVTTEDLWPQGRIYTEWHQLAFYQKSLSAALCWFINPPDVQ